VIKPKTPVPHRRGLTKEYSKTYLFTFEYFIYNLGLDNKSNILTLILYLEKIGMFTMNSTGEMYQPNSPILILTLDSFHKKHEGENYVYNPKLSILSSQIDDKCKNFLIDTRKQIFHHLKAGEIIWKNGYKESDYNDQLVLAKDFYSEASKAMYLPAIDRYDGDFFDGLGEKGKDYLLHSKHHLLILSALYGLLKPFELIQFYSCQFGEKNLCYTKWTNENGISKVFIDYIKKYKISKIFDFTACSVTAYHECIDWDFVANETSAEILHCYHQKTTTDKALKWYGRFVRNHILLNDIDELIKIKNGSIIDEIEFSDELKLIVAISETSKQIVYDWLSIIKAKEKKNIEFKQSLRWSFKTNEDKKLSEYNAMRAIASMLNTEGGFLFIGVKDGGEIIGIDNDYKSLQKQSSDGYLLHFDNLINNYLGREFHQYISPSIELINGKEVCIVQIAKSKTPVFVKSKDKSGNNREEFFIRGAASSQPLGMKDTLDYIKTRWRNN